MKKYTKGPWEIRGNKIFVKGTNNSIAQVHVKKNYEDTTFKPINDVEAIANAELLCAAPDLLDALEGLLSEVQCRCSLGSDPNMMEMLRKWQIAHKAIEKACPDIKNKEYPELDKKTLNTVLKWSGESGVNIYDLRGLIQKEIDNL